MMTWIPHQGRFSTNEVADIVGVSRLNFYEWTVRDYITPVTASVRRGNASVFDTAGLTAAVIFNRLRTSIRRPVAGQISSWYQQNGHYIAGDSIKCAMRGELVTFLNGKDPGDYDYIITIPIGSIRQWIETRIKEIHSHGQPEAHPD
jgi:hypothetical protein